MGIGGRAGVVAQAGIRLTGKRSGFTLDEIFGWLSWFQNKSGNIMRIWHKASGVELDIWLEKPME